MALEMFSIEETTDKDLSFLDNIDCHLVVSDEDLRSSFERLSKEKYLALDVETEGLSPFHHKIVGLILAPSETESYYFPLRHKIGKNADEATFIYYFKKLAETCSFILFNAKFDWKMIYHQWNIDFEIFADTQLQAYVLNSDLAESKNLGLKHLAKEVLGIEPLELSDFGETNFALFDPEEAYKYACPDGTNTFGLYNYYAPKIKELGLEKIEQIELSIVKTIGKMELTGIRVDTDILKAQQDQMIARIEELKTKIHELAGREFDITSPQQMSVVLYDELKIPPIKRNKEEDRSVGAEILKALDSKHPIIGYIRSFREVTKLYNDFVLKLPECLAEDSRLHGEFNQSGTRSGRFSASGGFGRGGQKISVNLQQLPKGKGFDVEDTIKLPTEYSGKISFDHPYHEDDLDKLIPNWRELQREAQADWLELKIMRVIPVKIRDALVPSKDYIWLSADYSQLEYRALANMSQDAGLIDAFKKGIDFHTATASDMLGVPIDKVDKLQRNTGKTINFGIVYGMTKYGLAQQLGCSPDEAEDLMNKYMKSKPKVSQLIERIKRETEATGYVRTYFGRIRWFKERLDACGDNYHRRDQIFKQAFNTAIQGTGADLAKIALARVSAAVAHYGDKFRILSQVHDEINFEVHKSIPLEEAVRVVDEAMSFRSVLPGWADIPVDIELGTSYGDLRSPEDFGVDYQSILKSASPTKDISELFNPLKSVSFSSSSSSQNTIKENSKRAAQTSRSQSTFTTREQLKSSVPKVSKENISQNSVQEISKGRKMMQRLEEKQKEMKSSTARLDLTNAKFPLTTAVIYKKPEIEEEIAFNLLKNFIANNFGQMDLVIEDSGMLYKFPETYRINDANIHELETAFEVVIFKSKPKISISL